VVASESLLTIQVYRGGPLAKAGHNHVIASHELAGTVYIPPDPLRTTFEVRLPVASLSVDEAALRAQAGQDFRAVVPDSAREGTRGNMLGQALLNAELFPQIVLRSQSIASGGAQGDLEVRIEAEVREAPHAILVPVHYELQPAQLTISGEMPLRQTDLGLTPFSAMLGALQVEDEMRVKFRIVARPAPPSGGAGH
jgi:polyisoprenoid-binding protein YceI